MEDCLFCKITNGEISAYKVFEDDHTLAFLDIQPNTPGHTLVIPKDHSENIYGISEESLCRTMISVKKVALAIKNGLEADGINIAMNNETTAGQVILHSHIHIIPRYIKPQDHIPHQAYKEGEAEKLVKKIKENLE